MAPAGLRPGSVGHEPSMLTILLIVLLVLILFGGFGFARRGR
jgi:hypothetical protein